MVGFPFSFLRWNDSRKCRWLCFPPRIPLLAVNPIGLKRVVIISSVSCFGTKRDRQISSTILKSWFSQARDWSRYSIKCNFVRDAFFDLASERLATTDTRWDNHCRAHSSDKTNPTWICVNKKNRLRCWNCEFGCGWWRMWINHECGCCICCWRALLPFIDWKRPMETSMIHLSWLTCRLHTMSPLYFVGWSAAIVGPFCQP